LYQLIDVRGSSGRTAAAVRSPHCRCTFAALAEYTQADCHFYLD
jgi:hypothetical protein